ncbi:cell wall integrity and stress response component 2-like [Salvelinus namaycush]|uniref:Cell wall integrity and stress response component 2-like n=1 Tax=Salvelinus namaycush TaxID=8040 RepID=A0A8U0UJY6_SALNM|nr:cell wall integrity and stress response component 2-like [Salvelinus namaycush]
MKKTRRKWRGLRDRSGSASSGQQPWRFCHILSFLDPCIVPRATSGNFTATPSTTSSTIVVATGASRPSTSPTSATITSTGGVRPSTTSSTSMTTTGAVRPSTTSSTSMTTTGAAMEDDEMEEAPLDLGPPEIIMNLTEVTTEDLVEQDVAVERNRERNEEEQCHTRRHRRYQTPDPLNSFQQRLLQAVERDAAQPDAHRKEDEETLFAMSLVPTLKRLPQQRQAAVKVKMYQLLFQAEFNEMESI